LQPSYATKDLANGSLTQDIHTEDCHYSEGRRYDFVDVASTSVICTTPYTYQGYQQYTMTDCHTNRSASLPPA